MTDEEFAQRKRTLDLQLEAGMALLQDSHRAQVRALELLRSASREAGAAEPAQAATAPAPVQRRKRSAAGTLYEEVDSVLGQITGTFNKNDVSRLLKPAPDRISLFRVLRRLEDEGRIEVEEYGSGRRMTTYRKAESDRPAADRQSREETLGSAPQGLGSALAAIGSAPATMGKTPVALQTTFRLPRSASIGRFGASQSVGDGP